MLSLCQLRRVEAKCNINRVRVLTCYNLYNSYLSILSNSIVVCVCPDCIKVMGEKKPHFYLR